MLSTMRKFFTGDFGLMTAVVLAVIAVNVGLNLWQRATINDLRDWQGGVLQSLAQAVDQRDGKGALLPVQAKDAAAHIAALGRLKVDTAAARDKARAADAENALSKERQAAEINRKAQNDYSARIEQARADAAAIRAAAAADADRLRQTGGEAGSDSGGGGTAPVPGLSAARFGVDEASGANRLPASACDPMTIDERLTATEQAIQLDELITVIEQQAEVHNP